MELNKTKYARWYLELVSRATKRKDVDGYYEEHHINPKCFGGTEEKYNLVKLTAREHYVAHLLLMKCYDNSIAIQKMCSAYLYLSKARNKSTAQRYNSRLYQYHKLIRTKVLKETMVGDGNSMFGRKHSEETRQKISSKRKGVNINTPEMIEQKRNRFLTNNPNNDPVMKQKQIEANSKEYKIMSPDGTLYEGKNLANFCRENKLNHGNLITYGKAKGWSILQH